MQKQIACVVSDADYDALAELAASEESSVSRILRRGVKHELQAHDHQSRRLINGKTRSQQAADKRKRVRRKAAAAA